MACHICAGFCFGGLTLITLSDRTKLPIEAVMMEISMANKQAYRLCESDGCYQVDVCFCLRRALVGEEQV